MKETISSTQFQRNIGKHVYHVNETNNDLVVTDHDREQYVVLSVRRYRTLLRKEREAAIRDTHYTSEIESLDSAEGSLGE